MSWHPVRPFSHTFDKVFHPTLIYHAPPQPPSRHPHSFRTKVAVVLVTLVIVLAAVLLPVYFFVIKPQNQNRVSSANPGSPSGETIGRDGSIVRTENGTEFTYHNQFGGFWAYDASNPYAYNAQPNSWTPPLNETWDFTQHHINGVNIGGLFVLEPFITPDLFQRYPGTEDEYALSKAMSADTANGGLSQLEKHYDTFISEQDIAEIAGAGLNFIRLPIPFWAVETWEDEPFLARTSWKYIVRLLEWARKYGLRVCLDLHTIPGSQNGYNHSGKLSSVNFLLGNMGYANAQRALYYIRVLTEFISQPEYRNLVPMFGIVNEALIGVIGMDSITSFYIEAHDMIRDITGKGEGNGPFIVIHDGFQPLTNWKGYLAGADRLALDQHPYFSFGAIFTDPIAVPGPDGLPGGKWPKQVCDAWGASTNTSKKDFGLTIAGEFSGSFNDCGLMLRGVANPNSTNPQCPEFNDWRNFNSTMKEALKNYVVASMDAFQDWFFWTWKISGSNTTEIGSPLWSYQLGYRNGWIPEDPREAVGKCASLKSAQNLFDGLYEPWQTGRSTSSVSAQTSQAYPWPPKNIMGAQVPMSLLPSYTPTGQPITLPVPTFTGAPSHATQDVDGWASNQDVEGGIVPVSGCTYPGEYDAAFPSGPPTAACTGPTNS